MLALYRSVLYLYPEDHRREFGDEMQAVFAEAERSVAVLGASSRMAFYGRELFGLIAGAMEEHIRCLTGIRSWGVLPWRRRAMRSEFRFSKATPVLMALILVAIVIAIEKATAIRNSVYPASSVHVGPLHAEHFTFVPSLMLMFACAYLVGMIGWAIVYALHRSGVHRLDGMKGGTE